ncbi:MAG: putative bifunctional diguanylate cyclase/phosphodiesterase [Burkholderiales bacterium]
MSTGISSGHLRESGRVLDYDAFAERIDAALASHGEGFIAALLLEIKEVWRLDGSIGLRASDLVVRQVAERLAGALRDSDVVGHIGRDRLGCLLGALPSRQHAVLAANKVFRSLSEPFQSDGRVLYLSAHLGIAYADQGCDGQELLRRAANAASDALSKREPFVVYDGDTDPLVLLQFDLQADLKRAIENNDLFMCYQPKVNVSSERIIGAEALLRWNHPEKGMIPPDRLVQVADSTGLISSLTQWVMNTALRECTEYRRRGLDIGVSINFSTNNLREREIVALVEQALQLWTVPVEHIVIELTETAVMDEQPMARDTVLKLKELGVELSMDDFGTGYSSLGRLRDLPLDELKIDMSFVRNMLKSPVHERIVQSMVSLAHGLNLRVVAEGVEDRDIFASLKAMGCDVIQGYLVGKPLPLEEFVRAAAAFPGIPNA